MSSVIPEVPLSGMLLVLTLTRRWQHYCSRRIRTCRRKRGTSCRDRGMTDPGNGYRGLVSCIVCVFLQCLKTREEFITGVYKVGTDDTLYMYIYTVLVEHSIINSQGALYFHKTDKA